MWKCCKSPQLQPPCYWNISFCYLRWISQFWKGPNQVDMNTAALLVPGGAVAQELNYWPHSSFLVGFVITCVYTQGIDCYLTHIDLAFTSEFSDLGGSFMSSFSAGAVFMRLISGKSICWVSTMQVIHILNFLTAEYLAHLNNDEYSIIEIKWSTNVSEFLESC